jgi:tetratricopeptide (TPR) repeat protein
MDHGSDPELLYWGALAYARAGATRLARVLLDRVENIAGAPAATRREALCLSGRLWKDRIDRSVDGDAVGIAAMEKARADYLAAYAIDADSYPGANAATLSMLVGDRADARTLAENVIAGIATQTQPLTSWQAAALGEAQVILGSFDDARESYRRACALAPDDTGSIASMRRQLELIGRVIPGAHRVLDALPVATVIAFAGHMIDRPGRDLPRFPPWLEPFVADALRKKLAGLHRPIVYTSAACGGDLLFIEAAFAIDAEVNIVMPFDREDFVRTSVAIAGAHWVDRFDRALERASRVVQATDERYLGDDVLFEHAQRLVSGLAVLRASQLQTEASMLCVLHEQSPSHVGGTRGSYERWTQTHERHDMIELDTLAQQVPAAAKVVTPVVVADENAPSFEDASPDRPRRTMKVTLFADMAGFGRLHDAQAPLFHTRFLGLIAEQIAACPTPPLEANTWGDALYMVFEEAGDGAAFGLGLIDRMRKVDWVEAGLSETSHIRIALHAGPVFCGFDPIINHDNYFGTSVTKTARIEPITPPGLVYASEAFVATLAWKGPTPYVFEYVGELELAKSYGTSRIYRVERR